MSPKPLEPVALSIAAVERDTGLGKDTLRVWERRYGFPSPDRDEFGERAYPPDQVVKLRAMKRLIDLGHLPSRIVKMTLAQLQKLAQEQSIEKAVAMEAQAGSTPIEIARHSTQQADLLPFIEAIKNKQPELLKQSLHQALVQKGVETFVRHIAAPLTDWVGVAWMRAEIEVHDEHLYTDCMSTVLRFAIGCIPRSPDIKGPTILLTTLPQEEHGLGLLMAECLMALGGARCITLGTQTPLGDIVSAARAHKVDVVALSFSVAMKAKQVVDGLQDLRDHLDAKHEIWAGGKSLVLYKTPVDGVRVVNDLEKISSEINRWRAQA
jgi:DNA-binding transcriptional MerR regulator